MSILFKLSAMPTYGLTQPRDGIEHSKKDIVNIKDLYGFFPQKGDS